MSAILNFIKITLLGGLLFLFPVVALIFVLGKAFNIIQSAIDPLITKLEVERVFGFEAPFLLATLVLIAACFCAGLLARSEAASRLVGAVESTFLVKIPGYTIFKSAGENLIDINIETAHSTVLVRLDDAWQLALRIETIRKGDMVAVFIPDSPTPQSGSVMFVTADRVKPTNIPIATTIACLRNRGVGSDSIFAKVDID